MIAVQLNRVLNDRQRTLYWLAKESGIPYATVWRLNRGEISRIGLEVLDRICEVLECEPGDILTRITVFKKRK